MINFRLILFKIDALFLLVNLKVSMIYDTNYELFSILLNTVDVSFYLCKSFRTVTVELQYDHAKITE